MDTPFSLSISMFLFLHLQNRPLHPPLCPGVSLSEGYPTLRAHSKGLRNVISGEVTENTILASPPRNIRVPRAAKGTPTQRRADESHTTPTHRPIGLSMHGASRQTAATENTLYRTMHAVHSRLAVDEIKTHQETNEVVELTGPPNNHYQYLGER